MEAPCHDMDDYMEEKAIPRDLYTGKPGQIHATSSHAMGYTIQGDYSCRREARGPQEAINTHVLPSLHSVFRHREAQYRILECVPKWLYQKYSTTVIIRLGG